MSEPTKFQCLDAGYGKQGTLFSLGMLGKKAFVHISLPQGYMVFLGAAPDAKAASVKNALADFYDHGKSAAERDGLPPMVGSLDVLNISPNSCREFFCHWLARVYEAGHRDTSYEEGETLDSVLREINQVLGFSGYEPESKERADLLQRRFAWNEMEKEN